MDRTSTGKWSLEKIISEERVIHLYANDCYKAHLSLYHFATQWLRPGSIVLDAGSGSGYGSAYLAEQGAGMVHGIDLSEQAVEFSKDHFQLPNLTYQAMSLERIRGFQPRSFDLIYTSNVLEHIIGVPAFLRSAWELLKEDGTLIAVVPPIISQAQIDANLANPFHLNIWSPRQWSHVLRQYFLEVQCYSHTFERTDISLDFCNQPEQSRVSEKDFTFRPVELEQLSVVPTMSAIFIAHGLRSSSELPLPGAAVTFVDSSFSRPPVSPAVSETTDQQPPLPARPSLLQVQLRRLKAATPGFIKKPVKQLLRVFRQR